MANAVKLCEATGTTLALLAYSSCGGQQQQVVFTCRRSQGCDEVVQNARDRRQDCRIGNSGLSRKFARPFHRIPDCAEQQPRRRQAQEDANAEMEKLEPPSSSLRSTARAPTTMMSHHTGLVGRCH